MRLILITALFFALPFTASAQDTQIHWTCALNILCPDAGACRDWDQFITIREEEDGAYNVEWGGDLPSDYQLVANYPAPEDAVQDVWVRTIGHFDTARQTTQIITFDSTGHVVVTSHQPHANTRTVTGIGSCELAE